jgi:uncharacterized membrane protein YbaN (DUF454 family)
LENEKPKKELSKFNKNALVVAGHSFVGLGILGMILPIMPTTVFLLLAAACYAKSSPRFYHWLHTNKLFGKHLKNYQEKKGISLSVKIFSSSVLWISILFSIYMIRNTSSFLYISILLLIIALAITIHLFTIKTHKSENN